MPASRQQPARPASGVGRGIVLPCVLLFGAMFNLTLVVAGLKEFIIDELGGTDRHATWFFSIETLAYVVFAPLWGLASDRLGRRKPFVVAGFLVSALIYAAYGQVEAVGPLLALRFVQGATAVMGWSLAMAVVLDHSGRRGRGAYMGLMGASLIFGVALGAPTGGYLTGWLGARAPLQAAAVLFALLAVAALALREAPGLRPHGRIADIGRALAARPRLLMPMLFHFVDRFSVGLFVVVFPLYLDTLGAGPTIRGRYLGLFLLPFALLQFFAGKLAERTGPYPLLITGSLLYGALLAVVGLCDLELLRPVMVTLGVFAALMFPPALLLTAQLSDPLTRGSAMGGFNLAGSLGFAIGPLIGQWAYAARGFGYAFLVCGGLEVLLALAVLPLAWRWARAGPAGG